MPFQNLGGAGVQVSKLSFGCMTFGDGKGFLANALVKAEEGYQMMKLCYEHGINFFDNAETYGGGGTSEIIMGEAIKLGIERGTWERCDLVISTKLMFGARGERDNLNTIGLSRKHIIEGMRASLKRMQLDYVDLVFCHRPDTKVSIEETVRAMNWLIDQGLAFYWGTSEWNAQQLTDAIAISHRLGLIPPQFDQCQYSLIERHRVEVEFAPLYPQLGLTIWGPLSGGALTGKYSKAETRKDTTTRYGNLPQLVSSSNPRMASLGKQMESRLDRGVRVAENLKPIADELGCTLAQLSIAWAARNPNVSTVLLGATKLSQLEDTLKALDVIPKLTPEIMKKIDEISQTKPQLDAIAQQVIGLRGPAPWARL
eukprot:TRINITY_DN9850_c0_g1_i1.p1 TRINITY_DN9850_c0_g1~~TRINITY_DN9850_c0_g1_i1.p1  ORF type:complete len:381 (+),score=103.73 TRINITY_DN9850_c0_g1_i1:34-1143(+)